MDRAAPLLFLALVACSGGATPDAKAPEASSPSSASATPSSAPGDPASPASPPKKKLADHQRDFMSKCSVNGAAYCECAWGQMTALFSEDDMNTAPANDPRLDTFKKNVGPACAAKLPEDQIHTAYVGSCADDPKFVPFCECLWSEQRKKEPASLFVDPVAAKSGPAVAIKRAAAKACTPKMPEDFQREIFVKSCASNDALKPFCGCAWKAARTAMTPGEMGAGFLESDMEKLRPTLEKSCGKLRPAK